MSGPSAVPHSTRTAVRGRRKQHSAGVLAAAVFGRRAGRRVTILAAVPDGSQRAASQAAWIRALEDHPAAAELRTDVWRSTRAVAWILARHADWRQMTTRPTWDRLVDLTGLSRRTVARCIRRLRDWQLLGVVETGSTERIRAGILRGLTDAHTGNRAAEYVLSVPTQEDQDEVPSLGDENGTPSRLRQEVGIHPTYAHEAKPSSVPHWPLFAIPRTRGDMLQAAIRAQREDPTLRRLSPRHLRSLLRPLFAAGWHLHDIRHALNHAPGGRQHWHTAEVRHLPGWIRHRLTLWTTPPSQQPSRRTTDHAPGAYTAHRRQAEAQRTDPTTEFTQARALLRRRTAPRAPQSRVQPIPLTNGRPKPPSALSGPHNATVTEATKTRAATTDRALTA